MDTWIYENRRRWLEHWIAEAGGRPKFEEKYAYTRSQLAQFLSAEYNEGRSIGDIAARRIERKLKKPDRSMDVAFGEAINGTKSGTKNGTNTEKTVKKEDLLNASDIGELIVLFAQATPKWREFILGAARQSAQALANGDRRDGTHEP